MQHKDHFKELDSTAEKLQTKLEDLEQKGRVKDEKIGILETTISELQSNSIQLKKERNKAHLDAQRALSTASKTKKTLQLVSKTKASLETDRERLLADLHEAHERQTEAERARHAALLDRDDAERGKAMAKAAELVAISARDEAIGMTEKLQEELKALHEQSTAALHEQDMKLEELESALSIKLKEADELQATVEETSLELEHSSQSAAQAIEELHSAKLRLNELQGELSTLTSSTEEEIRTLREEIDLKSADQETLQATLSTVKDEKEGTEKQLAALTAELEIAQSQILDTAEIDALKEQNASLQEELKLTQQSFEQTKVRLEASHEKIASLHHQVEDIQVSSATDLESLKASLDAQKFQYEERIKELNISLSALESKKSMSEALIETARMQVQEFENERQHLQEMLLEKEQNVKNVEMSMQNELDQLTVQLEQMQHQLEERSAGEKHLADNAIALTEKLTRLEGNLNEAQKEVKQLCKDKEALECILASAKDSQRVQLEDLEVRKHDLEEELALEKSRSESLRGDLLRFKSCIASIEKNAEEHIDKYKASIVSLQNDLTSANAQLEQCLEESDNLRTQNATLQKELEFNQGRIIQLQNQVESSARSGSKKEEEYEELKNQNAQLEEQLKESLRNQADKQSQLQAELVEAKQSSGMHQQSAEQWKAQVLRSEGDNTQPVTEDQCQQDIKALRETITKVESERDEVKRLNQALMKKLKLASKRLDVPPKT